MKVRSYGYPVTNIMIFEDGTAWGTQASVIKQRELAVRYNGEIVGYLTSGVADSVTFDVPVGTYYLANVKTGVPTAEVSGKITYTGSVTTEQNLYSAHYVTTRAGDTIKLSDGTTVTSGQAVANGESITITYAKAEFYTITVAGQVVYNSTAAETVGGTKTLSVTGEVLIESMNENLHLYNRVKDIVENKEYTVYYTMYQGQPVYALSPDLPEQFAGVALDGTWQGANGYCAALSSAIHDDTKNAGFSTNNGDTSPAAKIVVQMANFDQGNRVLIRQEDLAHQTFRMPLVILPKGGTLGTDNIGTVNVTFNYIYVGA